MASMFLLVTARPFTRPDLNSLPSRRRLDPVNPYVELGLVVMIPTAVGYGLILSLRGIGWAVERWPRPPAPELEPIDRLPAARGHPAAQRGRPALQPGGRLPGGSRTAAAGRGRPGACRALSPQNRTEPPRRRRRGRTPHKAPQGRCGVPGAEDRLPKPERPPRAERPRGRQI